MHIVYRFELHWVAIEVRVDEGLDGDVFEECPVEGYEAVVHVAVDFPNASAIAPNKQPPMPDLRVWEGLQDFTRRPFQVSIFRAWSLVPLPSTCPWTC